jgi:glycosyltransferase involved in cell wall biosynthesis
MDEWELIVVNNNSTDHTENVLDSFVNRLPLRRMFEPVPGLSNARNRAVRHATGEYVVWTDDDVLVDQNWLVAYRRAVDRWPDAAVFGGPVHPSFEGIPPPWLGTFWRNVAVAFAARELGDEPFELIPGNNLPFGPNFMVRTKEQHEFPYHPNLGRRQEAGALGEETDVITAILQSGRRGWWVPDAQVQHWIPKERQNIHYLRSYYTLLGKTYCRLDTKETPRFGGKLWRETIRAEFAYFLARLNGDPDRWLQLLVEASMMRGIIARKREAHLPRNAKKEAVRVANPAETAQLRRSNL